MTFSTEEIDTIDGERYRSLVNVSDTVGAISDLRVSSSVNTTSDSVSKEMTRSAKTITLKPTPTSKIISIEEIDDNSDSEDEDLPMYEKPDSDEEDEDEDPTLVQRNKPTAPVSV